MQALELQANIDDQRQIHLQLPENIRAKTARIIVMYEELPTAEAKPKRVFGQFRGKIRVAKDFDAELPDEFWLGKDP